MRRDRPLLHPYLALWIGVLSISTSAIFVKLISAPAPIAAAYRLLFAVLLMTPFALRKVRAECRSIPTSGWGYALLSGILLAAHFILWFESLEYTSVASSVVLVCLQPLFAFIGGYLAFGERLGFRALSGGILAFLGSVLIGWGDFRAGGLALLGDLLALLAAAMITGYWMIGQTLRQTLSLLTYTYLVYGIAALALVGYGWALHVPFFPYPVSDWVYFLCLAVFPTLLGHSILNWLVRRLGASTVSMSILGEPIGAAILAYFILGEKLKPLQWFGGTLILLGIYLFLQNREASLPSSQKLPQRRKGEA